MNRTLVGIREAAEFLGVTPSTLRRWEHEGKLIPDERTAGGYRRYDLARLRPDQFHHHGTPRQTVAYARVSRHDQKEDLERQKQVLELYCAR
ncbi:recombinase family protein [Sulfobacillus sp. hq2]|nr:MerR family DNA-binding transcriptional regulator [Sulfobacillus sp. hq2]